MKLFALKVFALFSSLLTLSVLAVEPSNCVACHTEAVSDWQESDHAKAMNIATPSTVLGDFNNSEVVHFTQKAIFYRDSDKFNVKLTEKNQTTNYTIAYTLGHYPLQQYLVPSAGGRLQVFPFAWDSRTTEQGGQRWYANYALEDLQPEDRLHWKQPLQNWNGMCADCHSDGLKRNYNIKDNRFDSEWDNINVGCQSCHGTMEKHDKSSEKSANLGWVLEEGQTVATWQGHSRDNQFMETCFSCHSLRAPLTDGFKANEQFLNQFSPTFLTPDIYHADGQIKEEVYVYGSFLQSKMYAAGVNCLDCHDAHTMKVKLQSNALCLQCHSANHYETETHTFHSIDSQAAQCVSCHMPEMQFMGVDDRRDHSFKVPKPHLSQQYNTLNACVNCHQDQSDRWAAETLNKWFGAPQAEERGEQLYLELQRVRALPLQQHFELIDNNSVSEIKRATAVSMLPLSTRRLSDAELRHLIHSTEPLIRLAAARIGFLLPIDELSKSYGALLVDEYKAVRVAAVNQLLGTGLESTAGFAQAFAELNTANETTSWRAEGRLNMSEVYAKQAKPQANIRALKQAIVVDPYFDASYINLVDIYRQSGQIEKELEVLQAGLKANPKSGMLHYVKGLSQIRSGEKEVSVQSLVKAVELDSTNPQFAYVYFLALDSTGKTAEALGELRNVIRRYGADQRLGKLGLKFAKDTQIKSEIEFFENYLKQ